MNIKLNGEVNMNTKLILEVNMNTEQNVGSYKLAFQALQEQPKTRIQVASFKNSQSTCRSSYSSTREMQCIPK